jgi:hypothetical protein
VRYLNLFSHTVLPIGLLVAGCASAGSAAPASLTAAQVPSRESAPSRDDAPPAAPSKADAPAGQLVCRATSAADGTTELWIDWSGESAKGRLRTQAPSGLVYEEPVTAERHGNLIVADEPNAADVSVHAATVVLDGGKKRMRLGDRSRPWSPCE